jgi:hypothetical protein
MLVGISSLLSAEDIDVAPPKLQAGLFVKLLAFNKGLASGGDISIHVMGSPEFAAAMKAGIGKAVGQARISAITEGNSLPTEKPEVIYVGSASMTDTVVEYTRANHIMSITGRPDQVEKGVTLGVGVLAGKPRILLNLWSSREEGIDWNPAVLKISTVIK